MKTSRLFDTALHIMREVGRQEILPRFQKLRADQVYAKESAGDIVTDADLASERAITALLQDCEPHALIVGEEAVARNPRLLESMAHSPLTILLDPLDGTWNFVHGLPLFGMMLAVVMDDSTIAGIIHYPAIGDSIVALKGQGSWHLGTDNSRTRLRVARTKSPDELAGIVSLSQFPVARRLDLTSSLQKFGRSTWLRCSAYEYRLLSQGSMDFVLNAQVLPWDHAAGQLIHSEAGGYSAMLSGEPYSPLVSTGHLLSTSNEELWLALCDALCAPPTGS